MHYDVIVVGAGNAALSAAIEARRQGSEVLVLERAPEEEGGGNSRFTGGLLRFTHGGLPDISRLVGDPGLPDGVSLDIPPYTVADYVADVVRLSDGTCDERLITVLAERSSETVRWFGEMGMRFELYDKHVQKDGVRSWPDQAVVKVEGGGPALVDAEMRVARDLGIPIRYATPVTGLERDGEGAVTGVHVDGPDGAELIGASCVVLASGGFEASPERRVRHLGQEWSRVKVRGTRHNTGELLELLTELGAQPAGEWNGAHAVPVDAGAPDTGDLALGALTTRTSYPYALMVNLRGERFTDEGADFKLYTYARIGHEILLQPEGRAFQLFDRRSHELVEERYAIGSAAVVADSVGELARALGTPEGALEETVAAFNASIADRPFNPAIKDGRATTGIVPPKSNWALALEHPPFYAYGVTCGITFTYGGCAIDTDARVLDTAGRPIPGLYATGEITGAFFARNYPAGAGLMRGAVFGRLAGAHAAARARGSAAGPAGSGGASAGSAS